MSVALRTPVPYCRECLGLALLWVYSYLRDGWNYHCPRCGWRFWGRRGWLVEWRP